MASFEEVEPDGNVKGRRIWTAQIMESEDHDGFPTVYVLTEDTFHYFLFEVDGDQTGTAVAFSQGADPEDVEAAKEVVIPLQSITQVERMPGKDWFYIHGECNGKVGWWRIRCPDGLALTIFRVLQKRLRSKLRFTQERGFRLISLSWPASALVVVWFFTLMVWAGSQTADDNGGDRFGVRTKGEKAVDGAKRLGRQLGPTTTLMVGGVLSVGCLGWGLIALFQRPVKKVLRPRKSGERTERDQDDADEEVEEVAARPRAGKKTAPARKGAKRGAGKKVRALGIVALVLAVPAVALGWLSSLQVIVLLVAIVGLGIGIWGILAAQSRHGRGQSLPIAGSAANGLGLVIIVAAMMLHREKPVENKDAASQPADAERSNSPRANIAKQTATNALPKSDPVNPPVARTPAGTNQMLAAWGDPTDPDGDCKIEMRGKALVIDVPGTPHGLAEGVGQGNAPRVMREVEGDFTIQVKVRGTLHPTTRGTASKALSFQAGGILVWDNKDNYARFVRSGQNRDGVFNPVVAWSIRADGKQGIQPQTISVPEQDIFLRLERRGRELHASYSLDGQQWTPLKSFQGLTTSRLGVGVMALNAAQQPMSVSFEGLRFER